MYTSVSNERSDEIFGGNSLVHLKEMARIFDEVAQTTETKKNYLQRMPDGTWIVHKHNRLQTAIADIFELALKDLKKIISKMSVQNTLELTSVIKEITKLQLAAKKIHYLYVEKLTGLIGTIFLSKKKKETDNYWGEFNKFCNLKKQNLILFSEIKTLESKSDIRLTIANFYYELIKKGKILEARDLLDDSIIIKNLKMEHQNLFKDLEKKHLNFSLLRFTRSNKLNDVEILASYYKQELYVNYLLKTCTHATLIEEALINLYKQWVYIEINSSEKIAELKNIFFALRENEWHQIFVKVSLITHNLKFRFIMNVVYSNNFHPELTALISKFKSQSNEDLTQTDSKSFFRLLKISFLLNKPIAFTITKNQIPLLHQSLNEISKDKVLLLKRLDVIVDKLELLDYTRIAQLCDFNFYIVIHGEKKCLYNQLPLLRMDLNKLNKSFYRLQFTDVEIVDFSNIKLSISALQNLSLVFPKLKKISLNNYTIESLINFHEFKHLEEANLSNCNCNFVDQFLHAAKDLKILTLGDQTITMQHVIKWVNQSLLLKIHYIDLRKIQMNFIDDFLLTIKKIPDLESFRISNLPFKDPDKWIEAFNYKLSTTKLKSKARCIVRNVAVEDQNLVVNIASVSSLFTNAIRFNNHIQINCSILNSIDGLGFQLNHNYHSYVTSLNCQIVDLSWNVCLNDQTLMIIIDKIKTNFITLNLTRCTSLTNKGLNLFLKKLSLSKVENLNLCGCTQITDEAFNNLPICFWHGLKTLNIKKTSISEQKFDEILCKYPNIIVEFDEFYLPACDFFRKRSYPDMTFIIKDQIFKAHRVILSKLWSEFKYHLFLQKKEVCIEDISANAFEKLLEFAYTGEITGLSLNIAFDLINLSTDWNLFKIKNYCETWIFFNLNRDNVFFIEEFAVKSQNTYLRYYIKVFIDIFYHPDEQLPNQTPLWEISYEKHNRRGEILKESVQEPMREFLFSESKYFDHLADMIERDLSIKVNNKIYKAHRAILQLHSRYFANLLGESFKEKGENLFKIDEITSNCMVIIINYLYNGNVPKLTLDELLELYNGADYFGLKNLKIICQERILNLLIKNEKIIDVFQDCQHRNLSSIFYWKRLATILINFALNSNSANIVEKAKNLLKISFSQPELWNDLLELANTFQLMDFGAELVQTIQETYADDPQLLANDHINNLFLKFYRPLINNEIFIGFGAEMFFDELSKFTPGQTPGYYKLNPEEYQKRLLWKPNGRFYTSE